MMDAIADADGDGHAAIEALCHEAFGPERPKITGLTDLNRGRGAFSVVVRVDLDWTGTDGGADRPASLVAKLVVAGPNGRSARDGGAYDREALAYRRVLASSPVAAPRAWAVTSDDDGGAAFLLDDLSGQRATDQLDGLAAEDAAAVAESLARFHRAWTTSTTLERLPVRRNTLAGLKPEALQAGLVAVSERWGEVVDDSGRRTLAALVDAHPGLLDRFDAGPATLCHGDPRADNLVFDREGGQPILFDWQQMAVQFGEADLAWLAATSLTVADRRRVEHDLVTAAGADQDRYRLGLALPGLAVLLLAQRELPTERAKRMVAESLRRIITAAADNDTASLGR